MLFRNLAKLIQWKNISGATVAGKNDTITATAIDTLGFTDVLFAVTFGTITASGTGTIKIQHSSDNGSSDAFADVAGSGYSYTAAVDSAKTVLVDVHAPLKRYLQLLIVRNNDQNAAIVAANAILSNADLVPPALGDASAIKQLNGTVSGTA